MPMLIDQPLMIGGLLIAMALGLGTMATVSLIRRDRARLGPTNRRFCRALGIKPAERRRLDRIARRSGAPCAASLLVSRGCFDTAAGSGLFDADHGRQLAAIRRRVFD